MVSIWYIPSQWPFFLLRGLSAPINPIWERMKFRKGAEHSSARVERFLQMSEAPPAMACVYLSLGCSRTL